MTYTVQFVSPETRQYETKFGPMVAYKVKFAEAADTVDISQKPTSPAPYVGQTMDGHIEETQYGHKFKKEYNQGGGGGFTPRGSSGPAPATASTAGTPSKGAGKFNDDPFTMYLSYAKDLAVALIAQGAIPGDKAFGDAYNAALAAAISGGKALYNKRPGAPAPPAPEPLPEAPTLDKVVEDVFGDPAELLNQVEVELPWPGN